MNITQKINDRLVSLFNIVMKTEEEAIKKSSMHNLSITEVHTLVAIGLEEARTMSQVAETLKISVSTLTSAINRLVEKKVVNRFRGPNRRIMMLN